MSIDDETESRARAAALIDSLAGKAKQVRRPEGKRKRSKRVRQAIEHNKGMHKRRRVIRKTLARAAAPKRFGRYVRPAFSLVELLVMRTDGAKWYTFAQLRALLPETTESGVKAIVFQRAPRLGLVERAAIIEDPDAPWSDGAMALERRQMATRSRYRYRIGAKSDTDRARLRDRWRAHGEVAEKGENA